MCQKKDWPEHKLICKVGALPKPPNNNKYADVSTQHRERVLRELETELANCPSEAIITIEEVNLLVKGIGTIQRLCREIEGNVAEDVLADLNLYGSKAPIPIVHNDIIVSPSKRHGLGVFATKSIPANVVVTFYPCEAAHYLDTGVICLFPVGDELDLDLEKDRAIIEAYKFHLRPHEHLSIIGNPRRTSEPRLLGHLINDGAKEVFANLLLDTNKIEESKELLYIRSLKYMAETKRAQNCVFRPNASRSVLSIITTRDIEADEELFVSYGINYWLENQVCYDYKEKYPLICDIFV